MFRKEEAKHIKAKYKLKFLLNSVNYIFVKEKKMKFRILLIVKKIGYLSLFLYLSYYIIAKIIDAYENNSISLVIENLKPSELQNFPSVAACEIGYTKETYSGMEELMEE